MKTNKFLITLFLENLNISVICEQFIRARTISESREQIWKRGLFVEARHFLIVKTNFETDTNFEKS